MGCGMSKELEGNGGARPGNYPPQGYAPQQAYYPPPQQGYAPQGQSYQPPPFQGYYQGAPAPKQKKKKDEFGSWMMSGGEFCLSRDVYHLFLVVEKCTDM